MAPGAALGVRAGAGGFLGKQQPHALRGQERGVAGAAGDPHSSCQQLCGMGIQQQGTGMGTVPTPALNPQIPAVPTARLVPSIHPWSQQCWEGIVRSSTVGAHWARPGSALGAAG